MKWKGEMRTGKHLGLLLLLGFCAGCVAAASAAINAYKTYSLGKGAVKAAKAMKPIGLDEEKAIGGSLALQVFNRFGGMYPDPALQRYITLVGQSLAGVSDRPEIEYHFAVVSSDQPNAFATPGGYVFVSAGLLRLLENEAELAGVLGHEIAHISRKHALKSLEKSKKLAGLGALTIGMMGADPGLFDKVIDQAADTLFSHGLSKDFEFEADRFGTQYAARLGYDPTGLRDFLEILKTRQAARNSIFFSTHPSPQDRHDRLASQLADQSLPEGEARFAMEFQKTVQGHL